jgi:hypothetical protein
MLNGFILIVFILVASIELEISSGKVIKNGLDVPVIAKLITLRIWLIFPGYPYTNEFE